MFYYFYCIITIIFFLNISSVSAHDEEGLFLGTVQDNIKRIEFLEKDNEELKESVLQDKEKYSKLLDRVLVLEQKLEKVLLESNKKEILFLESLSAESLYLRGRELLTLKQYDQSRDVFELFISKYVDHELIENAYYWYGETYYVEGKYQKALEKFEILYEKYPQGRKYYDVIFKILLSMESLQLDHHEICKLNAGLLKEKNLEESLRLKVYTQEKRLECKKLKEVLTGRIGPSQKIND